MFSSQRLLNILRRILHDPERAVPGVLSVGSGASHYEATGREEEEKGEYEEVSVESSLDKTVPLDFQ